MMNHLANLTPLVATSRSGGEIPNDSGIVILVILTIIGIGGIIVTLFDNQYHPKNLGAKPKVKKGKGPRVNRWY